MRTVFSTLLLLVALLAPRSPLLASSSSPAPSLSSPPFNQVLVDNCKTSITLGSISMKLQPFVYSKGCYSSPYEARVMPLFFMSEKGTLEINFTDELLAQLMRGERVQLTGRALKDGKPVYEVTGHATPEDPKHPEKGKIKVRVHVSKRIELIFNTQYRFEGV